MIKRSKLKMIYNTINCDKTIAGGEEMWHDR